VYHIRVFISFGRILKEPCPDSINPEVQHVRYKDAVESGK